MHKHLIALVAGLALAGCSSGTEWADIKDTPTTFADGVDNTRTDEEIKALVYDTPEELTAALTGKYVSTEADPVFGASVAGAITDTQVGHWDSAYGWGNHTSAGYLKAETDPSFTASPAANILADDLTAWDTAYGWGNHASAGYLKTETEPVYVASAAATITTTKIASWDAAVAWGDHSSAGYLKTESDPKVGANTANYVPLWTGTALESGSIYNKDGLVGIGTTAPAAILDAGAVGATKTCSLGTIYTKPAWANAACQNYCQARGYTEGYAVYDAGAKSCGSGGLCEYISDFENCTRTTGGNDGYCGCAATQVCDCQKRAANFRGSVTIGSNGYLQLVATAGAPPATHCNHWSHFGRMRVDPNSNQLWVCMASGWVAK